MVRHGSIVILVLSCAACANDGGERTAVGSLDASGETAPAHASEAETVEGATPGAGSRPARQVGVALGSPDAPLTVTEFSDPGCYSCGTFAYRSFPELRREFIDTGLVQWRTVLLQRGFANGAAGAHALRCADAQGGFWELRRAMAQAQRDWTTTRAPSDHFVAYAREVGLDADAFLRCLEVPSSGSAFSPEELIALNLDVRAVPVFLAGSRRIIGALSTQDFRAILQEELALVER